ncbi:MAG: helix-turn-helix domain-containing protein [Halieaceae bacterium]|jgi:AraC-like DNA-binding protein|nr:helix-turn-helix domain-containing protein [Halieaceae bacterium]
MPDLLIAAISFSLAQVGLGLALLLRQPGWGIRERLYALLMVAITAYLCMPLVPGTPFEIPAATLQTAVPGAFYLFSASVFDDDFRLRPWQLGLVGFTVLMPLVGMLVPGAPRWLFFTLPQAAEFVLLGLTLWVVSRHWRTDLVEARRRLRLGYVGINGAYLLLLVMSREILFPGAAWLATWEYLPPALLLFVINLFLLEYRSGLLFLPAEKPPVAEAPPVAVAPELLTRLEQHMQAETAWRQMGLTLGELAAQIEVPQYRLRQAINGGLGYRNFSDFLNSYRVKEAAERLASPADAQLPVLTIAMDAGFRSLSSFNKAFKEVHQQTPTAWRRAHLGSVDAA